MSKAARRFVVVALLLVGCTVAWRQVDSANSQPIVPQMAGAVPLLARQVEQPLAAEPTLPAEAPVAESPQDDFETVAAPRMRVLRMLVTAYCPCAKCCGKYADGITASGLSVRTDGGRFVAADTGLLPFHTHLSVPGYHDGRPVRVLDRGGKIKGHRLDLFFPTHAQALQWGRQWVDVTVYEE